MKIKDMKKNDFILKEYNLIKKDLRTKIKSYLLQNNDDFMLVYRQICLDIDFMNFSDYDKHFFRKYCHDYLVKLSDKKGV